MADKERTTTNKAFKSCVECRRRKIRCSLTKEDTHTCRRCEERGVPCVPQVSSRNAVTSRANSKARISHLEAEVKQLRDAVFVIQKQLDCGRSNGSFTRQASSTSAQHNEMELDGEDDDSEDDSDNASSKESEIIFQDRPSHMEPLFQNELISSDARQNMHTQHLRQGRTMAQRLETARNALQPLVPTQEQLAFLGSHISSWLTLLQEMSPMTSLSGSKDAIIASYPLMKEPDVDPFKLACWLLLLAITTQQLHPQANSPLAPDNKFRHSFPQAVQRAVDNHIVSHDSLCGTLAGLETCLMFLRLSLMKGIIQKSWLGLRRVISIAELIGLPRASKLLQQQPMTGMSTMDPHNVAKAKLWESICSIERLAGTLMNFPIATRQYSLTAYEPLVSNGMVNAATFWIRLGNIAAQLSDLDDLPSIPGSELELYNQVLRLDNDLRLLASETPRNWWSEALKDNITSGDIIKFQFYCICMRIHLPFVVRSDVQNRFAFSRMAGVEACRSLASAWCDLRQILPSGIFFSRPFDAQAFTASAVLLLNSYNREVRSNDTSNPTSTYKDDTDALFGKVVQIMEEKAQDPIGSEYAQQASSALRSLMTLLNGDSSGSGEFTAKIPSFGTITVRRKPDRWANFAGATNPSLRLNQNYAPSSSNPLPSYQVPGYPTTESQVLTNQDLAQLSSNSVDDVFSWVIDPNDELLFHDNLVFEDAFSLHQWQPAG